MLGINSLNTPRVLTAALFAWLTLITSCVFMVEKSFAVQADGCPPGALCADAEEGTDTDVDTDTDTDTSTDTDTDAKEQETPQPTGDTLQSQIPYKACTGCHFTISRHPR